MVELVHKEEAEPVTFTVDALIWRDWEILFIERKYMPFAGMLALPGGKVESDEPIEVAIARKVEEEVGITAGVMNYQLAGLYTEPGRDPRGRYMSALFVGHLRNDAKVMAGSDAASLVWLDPREALSRGLAFDHAKMVYDMLVSQVKSAASNLHGIPAGLAAGIGLRSI